MLTLQDTVTFFRAQLQEVTSYHCTIVITFHVVSEFAFPHENGIVLAPVRLAQTSMWRKQITYNAWKSRRVHYPSKCDVWCAVVSWERDRHLFTDGQTRAKAWMKLLAFLYWRGGASHTTVGGRGREGRCLNCNREVRALLKRREVGTKTW